MMQYSVILFWMTGYVFLMLLRTGIVLDKLLLHFNCSWGDLD